MIDTPGHDSFNKFRASGVNLCDIALLVVDITKGIQKTTIESIKILKQSKTPFIVVLNKLDKINGWKSADGECFIENLKKQEEEVRSEYQSLVSQIMVDFPRTVWKICKDCKQYIRDNIQEFRARSCKKTRRDEDGKLLFCI